MFINLHIIKYRDTFITLYLKKNAAASAPDHVAGRKPGSFDLEWRCQSFYWIAWTTPNHWDGYQSWLKMVYKG